MNGFYKIFLQMLFIVLVLRLMFSSVVLIVVVCFVKSGGVVMVDDYLNQLCELKEDEFTKEILKPLFEAMGYERVEFNGGPYERGRDLIAQIRIPPQREMFVVYVQSKKIGHSQNVTDSAKFTQLAHQLRQCCTTSLIDNEGKALKPNLVYLACPEQIKNRFLEEVMGQLVGMSVPVKPYDGVQIISDIKDYKPELLEKLRKMESKISSPIVDMGRNEELLLALKSDNKSDFNDYYSDLSFFVGSFDSNLLLNIDVEFSKNYIDVPEESWKSVKKEVLYFYEAHGVFITLKDFSVIEEEFAKKKEVYESEKNMRVIKRIEHLSSYVQDIIVTLSHRISELRKSLSDKLNPQLLNIDDDEVVERRRLLRLVSDSAGSDRDGKRVKRVKLKKDGAEFYKEIDSVIDLIEKKDSCFSQIDALKNDVVEKPFYKVEIDVELIFRKINSFKKEYFEGVSRVNSRDVGPADLKVFLSNTESSLSFLSRLVSEESNFSNIVSFKAEATSEDRVSISPHDIFSTRHDVAVYGGAGVGKTTTLKMYADKYSGFGKGVVIYIPLNSLVSGYKECFAIEKTSKFLRNDLLPSLVLLSGGVDINEDSVREARGILSEGSTLILDGLDEVYNTISGLLSEISSFKKSNPGAQLIISSRDCVSYLKEIDFLGITLLPFTRPQLKRFIKGWLGEGEKSESLIKSVEKKGLFDIIRTPLLATITCSLVERGVNAPSTEHEIYSERLRLLTGEYDFHKKIHRQKNTGDSLRKCARKIAFYMHSTGVRSTEKNKMFMALKRSLGDFFDDSLLLSCLDELVDPCNVIVCEPATSTYTFGHFRYQEFMASEEIKLNRDVDMTDLVVDDWWRGVLCLYAQENDFSFLMEDFYNKHGNIKKARITFKSMIESSPKRSRRKLREVFDSFDSSDVFDERILDVYEELWEDGDELGFS